ncbi:glycosyltransferase [Chitinophaga barathri]|uniref:Glycosyltransferase n=1 Tax=Chitinophaga barathri TaxID=1647451 RepID=A0A3N4MK60_9BACT|nr:glycosyltransferase [Chitinophaga barathri]RPD40480.1 glycosyltransferase [Chitinophaga barathri]
MKNVLFVITKSEIGGAQKFVKEQVDILTSAGFNCYLATNRAGWLTETTGGKIRESLIDAGIESRLSPQYLIRLKSFIRSNNIGLVICNSANGGLYGRLAARFAGTRSIYVTHGWSSVYNGGLISIVFNKVERFLSTLSDGVLCVSQNDLKIAKETIGIKPSRLKVILNSIYPCKAGTPRAASADRPVRVLTVCRLSHPKLPEMLAEAMEGIADATLTIVGDGNKMTELREIINSRQLTNLELKGEIPFFQDFLSYDIFALVSKSEGLPLSALEAMSAGLAIVISDVGGCSELIRENGELIDNNVPAIKQGIVSCMNNLEKFQRNSSRFFSENFDLNKNSSMYISYYNLIAGWS